MRVPNDYLSATRHPLPTLLLVLPLVLLYEGGLLVVTGPETPVLRAGVDAWLYLGLAWLGTPLAGWLPPALVVGVLLSWSWLRRQDHPRDLPGVVLGMALESVGLALTLWLLHGGLGPLLDRLGIELACPSPLQARLQRTIVFVGAGIYEEFLFRLVLFSAFVATWRSACLPAGLGLLLGGIGSALIFAAAHHLGPQAEPLDGYVFLFRALAGVFFAGICHFRGFGVSVGTHACYDVMVSVTIP